MCVTWPPFLISVQIPIDVTQCLVKMVLTGYYISCIHTYQDMYNMLWVETQCKDKIGGMCDT